MTFVIVLLCMFSYAGIGLVVGTYSRSRSVNKSFNKWHRLNLELNETRYYTKKDEEGLILQAMRDAKKYNADDWVMAAMLGGFFWPAFLFGYLWHYVYKTVESALNKVLPKSDIEQRIEQIHKSRALDDERKRIIKEARKMGIDTHALESLGD